MQADTALTQTLWQRLTAELVTILDQHHVCAAAAQTTARYCGHPVIVLFKSSSHPHYDAWISTPDGALDQIRLPLMPDLDMLTQGTEASWWEVGRVSAEILTHLPGIAHGLFSGPFHGPAVDNQLVPGGCLAIVDCLPPASPDHREMTSIASLITLFLERAFMRYDALRRTIVSEMAQSISDELTSTLSHEDIIETVSNPVRRILNVDSVSIGLVEAGSRELVFVPALLGPLFSGLPVLRLKLGQGIAGWVAQHGKPVMVNDVYNDARFYVDSDRQTGFVTRSILCVPLWVENDVVGVLEAINKRMGQFDAYDQHLLASIAGPLAIALENAKLHAQVLAEKRRMEALFANMSEGIVTTDHHGIITAANDSLLTLLRVNAGEIIGRSVTETMPSRPENAVSKLVSAVLEGEPSFSSVACDLYTRTGQTVPALISGARIVQEQGQSAETIFVFSDLREIREVERMRDDFFHNIIHELRTPLATILMYARLLRSNRAQDDSAKRERFLTVIERESDHLQSMVRQMLAAAKLEAREIQRSATQVNVNKLLEDITGPLSEQAQAKGLVFRTAIQPGLTPVIGDTEILYSIFKNLIENAIKFTPAGTVTVEAWEEASTIFVEVRDQGIGIPQTALPNLFKRFYRTQTAVEKGIAGTGLGLYMVKEGVERHKGTVDLISAEGVGTTFIVRLPVTSPHRDLKL